jgi:hypothetical protein
MFTRLSMASCTFAATCRLLQRVFQVNEDGLTPIIAARQAIHLSFLPCHFVLKMLIIPTKKCLYLSRNGQISSGLLAAGNQKA